MCQDGTWGQEGRVIVSDRSIIPVRMCAKKWFKALGEKAACETPFWFVQVALAWSG